ncbi:MAG: AEC family transporter [Solirubrobacterales bacterium]
MIWIALAVVVSVGAGLLAERRRPEVATGASKRALSLLLYVFFPPIVFVNLAETDFGFGMGAGLVAGLAAIVLVGLIGWFAASRLLALSSPETGSVITCSVIPNTSYLGYPVVLALMGGEELSRAVAYDVVVGGVGLTLLGFGAGAAFGARAGSGFGERLRSFFLKNPLLIAAILGLLTPSDLLPDVLVEVSWVLVTLSLPIGFFAVGAVIGGEQRAGTIARLPGFSPAVALVTVIRLVLAPGLLLLLTLPIADVPPSFYVLAAMPAGISSLVIAHAYGLDLRIAAESVAWTTGIVLLFGLAFVILG